MRGLGAKQKIGVEVDGRFAAGRGVEADGNGGGRRRIEERVHAQRLRDVHIIGDVHLPERHRLQWLFRRLPQHRRRPVPDLLACRGRLLGTRGIALGAHNVVQRRREIRIREALGDNAVDHPSLVPRPASPHFHDRTNSNRGIRRRPEMELVWSRGLQLRRDDPPDRIHDASLGSRDARRGPCCRSRGARVFRYSST